MDEAVREEIYGGLRELYSYRCIAFEIFNLLTVFELHTFML